MPLTPMQTLIMILAITFGTMITRFTPFVLFPEHREPPKVISDLGKMLPPAMMGLLVIYSLRNTAPLHWPYGLPQLIAITIIIILHKWKGNVLLSIGAGTAVCMFLVQTVFI